MEYTIAFDASAGWPKGWWMPLALPFLVAIGYFAIRPIAAGMPTWRPKHATSNGSLWGLGAAAAIAWAVIWSIQIYNNAARLSDAAHSGSLKVVEGRVSKFVAMPEAGHANERFCVNDACFEYSDYELSAGFNNASSYGGPIREGLAVRVTYLDNTIVKLEVAE